MKPNDRIDQILDAAEEIMSEKGLQKSSITEIARNAGVTDSLIYNYFKGKEDLLFSIPERKMISVLDEYVTEQLQGIIDPVSKLSKLIWSHLHFNDTYREYSRLLLLECRSNRNFYQHNAYTLIRKYAGILLSILEEGAKKQVFRADINMRLVRDIIFGVLDGETLSCLASQEIESTLQNFDDILGLIFPMITIQNESAYKELDKATHILRAAEKIFADKGYYQATISEIAKTSNVAEGTIYEYFKNKEHLLLSIPEQRFKEHIASLEEIFEIKTPLRKLRRMIRYHFFLYMKERNFAKVFLLHIQFNKKFYESSTYEAFQQYTQIIADILEEGKKDGSIRSNVNNRVFRNLFLGTFSLMALRWLILGGHAKTDLMREVDEVVLLLSLAVTNGFEGQE
jgi:TetR/AcrR family fatty acid metabolism transcriptional regulator